MFDHGYALLIGVDWNKYERLALPVVGKDIQRLAKILSHPDRCAYLPENIEVLTQEEATRENILGGLTRLGEKLTNDQSGNATAIVYFSGHGHLERTGESFLLPYDMGFPVSLYGVPAKGFAEAIAALNPRRLMVVLDCCHAEAMDLKGDAALDGVSTVAITAETPGFSKLATGEGRAVLSSSRSDQKSWIRDDGRMSVFTYHLIEALTGHAGRVASPDVTVTEVMDYVAKTVPATAKKEKNATQTPVFQFKGTAFPVALIMGGKGVAKGSEAPSPLENLPPKVIGEVYVDLLEGNATAVDIDHVTAGEVRAKAKAKKVKKGASLVGFRGKSLGRKADDGLDDE